MSDVPFIRSYLYAPGASPHVMEKALAAGADAIVFDLEDSVAPAEKLAARANVAKLISQLGGGGGAEIHVRINRGPDGPDRGDLAAVTLKGLTGIRLPKVAAAVEIRAVALALDGLEREAGVTPGSVRIYPCVETAAAALAAAELAAAPRVARLVFGATDFLADIGSPGAPYGPATHFARGLIVLASRAAGIGAPIDSVHTALDDAAGLRRGASAARELGFFGKSVIHPRQIAAVHDVFTPTAEELAEARRILEHVREHGSGASRLGDQMIDPAVVARAQRVVRISTNGERGHRIERGR